MQGGLAVGEYMDLIRIDIAALTESPAIESRLGFGIKCSEASYPRCRLCMDLIIVRIEITRPVPSVHDFWKVVPLTHGSVSGMNVTTCGEYL